ncbi:Ig-like domain-containing protein [Spiroplasma endosymbiont of Cantharis lateralis]|uniref:Ig-like domain-containing protein n=1 Tax=Spiroplasma endosymbiont of Cantharis lateralis TaxID=3066277 RepID=UPI00313D3534
MGKIFKPLVIILLIIGLILLIIMYTMPTTKEKKVQEQNFIMNHGNKDWHWIQDWEEYNKDHKNFEMYSSNMEIAHVTEKVIHDDGKFELNANSIGETFLTLVGSTKNSNLEKKWTFKAIVNQSEEPEKTNIELSDSKTVVEVGQTNSSLKIENYLALNNVYVESTDKNIATVFNDNETIHITAIEEGETKIIVNADNVVSPMEISVTVNKQLFDIDLSDNKVSVEAEETNSSIKIKNYQSLNNVNVQSKNISVAKVVNENETIKITGVSEGETKIIVDADNSNQAMEVDVTVNKQLSDIDLSNNKVSLEAEDINSSIKIKNYQSLNNVNIQSKNISVAEVVNENETIKITGVSEGETKIIVDADNAKSAVEINVTVNKQLLDINLSDNKVSLEAEETNSSIKIKNYQNLNNVNVLSKNISVAEVVNENETIKITGVSEGETKIIIDADNAKSVVEINVIVNKKLFDIDLSDNKVSVEAQQTDSSIIIKNYQSLNNISLKANNEKIINAIIENEITKITGLTEGETKIIVNADNAKNAVEINVSVTKRLFNIELSNNTSSIEVDNSDLITIKNYSDLQNVKAEVKNSNIALLIMEKNIIKITGVSEGETKIIVNADNAIMPIEINVVVTKKLFNIELSNNNTTLESGETNSSIKIKNFESLNDVTVQSKDLKTAEVVIENETIKVTGVSEGETKIIVNADNAKNALEINVTVTKKLINIELDNTNISIEAENEVLIKIENFESLINVTVTSNNPNIIGVTHENSNIVIEGLAEGETKIIVNADNARNPIEVNIKITKKLIDIKVNKTKVKIRVGSALTKIKILNYDDLENPTVENSSSGLITVTVKGDTISIKALLIGDAIIKVNADNAREVVKIEVKARLI